MTSQPDYPLEQMLAIKKNRLDAAIKTLEEKKTLLEKARQKLTEAEKDRDKTLEHKTAKLEQLRLELDQGTTTHKIQQSKAYLKIVDEQLANKQKKVEEQKKLFDTAQKQKDQAALEVTQRQKDLEKLEIHKKEWQTDSDYLAEKKLASEQDEQGSSTHFLHAKERMTRKKGREKKENESS